MSTEQPTSDQMVMDDRDREFFAIGEMIKAAEEHGLLAEAIWSFGQARMSGDSVESAARFAASEWDL